MVPSLASRPAVYHSFILFLLGSPQLPARASRSALCPWCCAQHVGGAPPVFPGAWVRECACTPTYWDQSDPKTATGDDEHVGWWLPVTEHVLPSLGASGGHSQPQGVRALPQGGPGRLVQPLPLSGPASLRFWIPSIPTDILL